MPYSKGVLKYAAKAYNVLKYAAKAYKWHTANSHAKRMIEDKRIQQLDYIKILF